MAADVAGAIGGYGLGSALSGGLPAGGIALAKVFAPAFSKAIEALWEK